MNQTTQKIYLSLLNHPDKPLSGEKLAEGLGISRAAVWKSIQDLKLAGYNIISIKGTGYLLAESDVLNAENIKHHFSADNLIETLFLVERSASTQQDAKEALLTSLPNYSLFLAKNQTLAHGRFKRDYFAAENQGIYMSLVIKPEQKFQEMPQYTILAATAIVKAIKKLTQIDTQIKWVNDIYLNGKKLAGILSEATTSMETGQINQVIIGIGLNFSIHQTDFPEAIRDKATSLFADTTPTITKNRLIAEIWNQFFALINTDFLKIYKETSFVLGKEVSFVKNNQMLSGRAIDITDMGELVVLLDSQERLLLSSGEISLTSF
ncbi:MAG: bifunctional biotin--[acetyl-CoA-carboxylase] ligase/biotin operon repressor BirA [Streptococcaceae bacterium]|nr:bifunctional biotin--[acetyl-CoA-carboxylase] ligase/biotin operon repressor BirA [Streptococcaceae bacterium]